jgi:basic amino acid/polyamine antiporter, APA family
MTDATTRKLSLFDATMLVMGGILGIGIFFTPPEIAREVTEPGAYLAMWGLGALAALSGAMTFAELSAAFPHTGGWYVFLREAFGARTSFLFAWVVLLVVSTGACALVARFFSAQVALLAGLGASGELAVAAGIVLLVTGIGLAGLKSGALFQNLCMLLKVAAVGTFIVFGLALFAEPAEAVVVAAADRTSDGLVDGMLGASLSVLFSYGGWQLISYIAPAVKDPERNLPRAIVMGVAGVAVIYLLVNLAYLRVLGIGGMAAQSDQPMANRMAELTLGADLGITFVTAAMAISALGFLVATLITTPGIYVAMAREGLFLRAFGWLHPRTGAPVVALVTQCALVFVYLGWSAYDAAHVDTLTGAVVFAEWIFHGLAGLALIVLARRLGPSRPFRSLWFPLFPATYAALAAAIVVGNLVVTRPQVTMLGVGVLAVGWCVHLAWKPAPR